MKCLRMIIFSSYSVLKEKGIPIERFSNDKTRTNKYGNKLIELCKRCSVHIANGRLDKDRFIGNITCKDASLVDYLILLLLTLTRCCRICIIVCTFHLNPGSHIRHTFPNFNGGTSTGIMTSSMHLCVASLTYLLYSLI